MMAVPGSWSGAIIGGLLFGIGMVLSRGCSGRLLVLAATGNLRSVVAGLVFAVVAQMSLAGLLSPARDWLAALWITSGGRNMDLLATLGLPEVAGFFIGLAFAALALFFSLKERGTDFTVFPPYFRGIDPFTGQPLLPESFRFPQEISVILWVVFLQRKWVFP